MDEHIPVLLKEAIEGLNIKPDGIYLDLTLGRAGHAVEILKRLSQKGQLIGFDQDNDAIVQSIERLKKIGNNFVTSHTNFRHFDEVIHKMNIRGVDGVLMDLGVSSPQFDYTERGFSYRGEAKLDMRMDLRQSLTAYTIVNTYSLKDLTKIFREYGEDKYAYPIAKRIVKDRSIAPITTTQELVALIKAVKPSKELAKKGHPAKQIFQALRIEVNDEIGALKETIQKVFEVLNPGGRLVIISFHSLEDKIVKDEFRKVAIQEGSRHNVYSLPTKDELSFRLITHKPIVPSEAEIENNHRAKSAKMRILERR